MLIVGNHYLLADAGIVGGEQQGVRKRVGSFFYRQEFQELPTGSAEEDHAAFRFRRLRHLESPDEGRDHAHQGLEGFAKEGLSDTGRFAGLSSES